MEIVIGIHSRVFAYVLLNINILLSTPLELFFKSYLIQNNTLLSNIEDQYLPQNDPVAKSNYDMHRCSLINTGSLFI